MYFRCFFLSLFLFKLSLVFTYPGFFWYVHWSLPAIVSLRPFIDIHLFLFVSFIDLNLTWFILALSLINLSLFCLVLFNWSLFFLVSFGTLIELYLFWFLLVLSLIVVCFGFSLKSIHFHWYLLVYCPCFFRYFRWSLHVLVSLIYLSTFIDLCNVRRKVTKTYAPLIPEGGGGLYNSRGREERVNTVYRQAMGRRR